MKSSCLFPRPTERVVFRAYYCHLVPRCAGCYAITSFDDDILYIGKSIDLKRRFLEHINSSKNNTKVSICGLIWFYYYVADMKCISDIEKSWMKQHTEAHGQLPTLNILYAPCV